MGKQAVGTFEIQSWHQKDYDEDEPKLTRARVVEAYFGDIEAFANIEYLVTSLPDGSAHFVGQIKMAGRIGDREGTLVIQDTGEYIGGDTARGRVVIVTGSGTGQLAGLRGEGASIATHGEKPVEYAGRTWNPTPEGPGSYMVEYDVD